MTGTIGPNYDNWKTTEPDQHDEPVSKRARKTWIAEHACEVCEVELWTQTIGGAAAEFHVCDRCADNDRRRG